jgi:hypothetical protein
MAGNYDSIDFDWTWSGDYIIGDDGDVQDTSDDRLLSLVNEITTVVKSSVGDWAEEINVGADLDDFVGEPNTRATADDILSRLESSLALIINPNDLNVRVTPVHIHKVLIMISVQVKATPENNANPGDVITLSFVYDYFEKGIFVPLGQLNGISDRRL